MEMKFGTEGWRAEIADSFTLPNVRRLAEAVSLFLGRRQKVLVGYDGRFLSQEAARQAAEHLSARGHCVFLSAQPCSTPALTLSVKKMRGRLGFMVTASHNPAEFNGVKLKGPEGGPLSEISLSQIRSKIPADAPLPATAKPKPFSPLALHRKSLMKAVALARLRRSSFRVVVDGMYGTACGVFEELLGKGRVSLLRSKPDPLFGGSSPEPIEENLSELKKAVVTRAAHAGFALDGDGDRLSAVDSGGRYVNSHKLFAVLAEQMAREKKIRAIGKTVSVSFLLDRIAKGRNLAIQETPVGFKYLSPLLKNGSCQICGEESGGIGFSDYLPDRDGALTALRVLEAMAKRKCSLRDLVEENEKRYGPSFYMRQDIPIGKAISLQEIASQKKEFHPKSLAGRSVAKSQTTEGGVKYILEDDSWLLLRASGTEPILRIYAESATFAFVKKLIEAGVSLFHHAIR